MWIREALVDPPRGARAGIGASWLRSVLLAVSAVAVGGVVDGVLAAGSLDDVPAPSSPIAAPAIIAAIAAIAAAVAGGVAESWPAGIRAREERSWRRRVLAAVLADDPRRAAASESEGALIDAATSGVESTAVYRGEFLGPTLASFSAPLLVLAVWASAVDVASAAILAAFIAIVPAVIMVAGKKLRRSNGAYRRRQAAATNRYLEMIEGLGTYRVLGAAPRARDAFAASARGAMAELTRLLARNQLMIIVNDAIFGVIMGGVATGLLLWRLADGAITPGAALAGLLMTVLLYEPIDRVGRTFYLGLGGRANRDHLDGLVAGAAEEAESAESAPEVAESADSVAGVVPGSPAVVGIDVELRGITVDVDGKTLLDDVTATFPAGRHTAIVGPSGAGKTTLLRVIAGARDARGEVLFGGVPTARAARRELVGVVDQHPGILGTTIADNLRLANPSATDAELRGALDRAHLLGEVEARPGGVESPVGDRGAHLSGGQRRRLTIARALLRPRPVLLLDEPTADLDRSTEARVRATLREIQRGRTTITVAHRLDTTIDADRVIVLDGGRIVATGTPDEVRAAADGYYARGLDAERTDS